MSKTIRRNGISPHEDLLPRDKSGMAASQRGRGQLNSSQNLSSKTRRKRLLAEIAGWETELAQAREQIAQLAVGNSEDPRIANLKRRIRRLETLIAPLPIKHGNKRKRSSAKKSAR